MKNSIQSRLIISASFVLFCFFGLAGFALDTAYQKGAQNALNERLQIHLYSILAAAELSKDNKIIMSSGLSEPRFAQIDSGLSAFVFDDIGRLVWRSASSAGDTVKTQKELGVGEKNIINKRSDNQPVIELRYKAVLENSNGLSKAFEFIVVESTRSLDSQVSGFRAVLWQWLGGVAVLLMVIQFFILRRSLEPLRKIVFDLEKIQVGEREHLDNHYSEELKDIADTLNRLVDNERSHLLRYRNTLADLAHSLKTPISVLTGLYEQGSLSVKDVDILKKQTLRMRQSVDFQLHKAAVKGHQTLNKPLHLEPLIEQILGSLDKVYSDKQLVVSTSIDKNIKFSAEKGDLFELFGNLLDNAYKWANTRVSITAHSVEKTKSTPPGIQIIIEDDGPGIPKDKLSEVMQRGTRVDESIAENGIGLAIVNELIGLYKGEMTSVESSFGGQAWLIKIPGRAV
ncbi:MAG: ATP-binding protein [Cycloclasticus sp.]|nr:ATP-binding protein [Cycloclasticus sp.]